MTQPGIEVRLRAVGKRLRDSWEFFPVSITMTPSYDPAVLFDRDLVQRKPTLKENDTP
jgi:hypothetical protein